MSLMTWTHEIRTKANPRGPFVITTRANPRKRAHLVRAVEACWQKGRLTRYHAYAMCEAQVWRAAVHMEVPDGIELCDACALKDFPAAAVVYRMYDHAGRLLYVGCTTNLLNRIRAHITGSRWWPTVARWTYEPYAEQIEAFNAEARAIVAERPFFNVDLTDHAVNPGRRRSAHLFRLHSDVTA